jgi:hypothetical protein
MMYQFPNNDYSRLRNNEAFLRLLVGTTPVQRKYLIGTATKDQIECILECAYNVLKRNVPLSPQQEALIRKYRTPAYKLIDKRIPITEKKRLLVQQRGGFLPALLAPIVGAILGAGVDRLINR